MAVDDVRDMSFYGLTGQQLNTDRYSDRVLLLLLSLTFFMDYWSRVVAIDLVHLQGLADKLTDNSRSILPDETLLALNLLMQFFFREAHSHGLVRRFLIKRINKEMQEGVQKGGTAVNKIIKGLKVRSTYFLIFQISLINQ